MALKDQILVSAVWTDSAVRHTNTTGTPVTSSADSGTGEALADEYTLAVSGVGGGTGTITLGTLSPNNPYKGRVVSGVALDGVTVHKTVIPGVSLVFSGATVNGNAATVYVGLYLGTFDAFGGGAGSPSAGTRHKVVNDGTGAVSAAKAQLKNMAKYVKKTGTVFDFVRPFADGSTEKVAGGGSSRVMPYALTVINVSGTGASKVGDLQVDGVTLGAASILDLSTGASVSGTGLKAISPGYAYRIQTGPLTGLEFALSANVASGDAANILIFQPRHIQIASDTAVVEGTYGIADVTLTQSGQAAGVIQPAGEAYYWTRVLVPAGASSESNPYPGDVALSATETGAAGWAV